jgi:hypothetical protein
MHGDIVPQMPPGSSEFDILRVRGKYTHMIAFAPFLIVLAVLLLCVLGMSIGVIFGRKPIKHCGGASIGHKGEVIDCPLCSNTGCKNNKQGACEKE